MRFLVHLTHSYVNLDCDEQCHTPLSGVLYSASHVDKENGMRDWMVYFVYI
jgi:hypothetical protein